MTKLLSDGLGATTGHAFSLYRPIWMSGNVWYVSSVRGADAASPRGLDRGHPLATFQQALANSAAGDIVVFLSDHDETLTVKHTIDKVLRVIGEGRAAGVPMASLTIETSETDGIEITADHVDILNVNFRLQTQNGSGPQISVEANDVLLEDLYFHLGENSEQAAVQQLDGELRLRMKGCTFVSESEDAEDRPSTAVVAAGDNNVFDGCVFDGGELGFDGASGPFALDGSEAAQSNIRYENLSLLNGADILLHASTTGWVNVETATGGAKVAW